MSVLWIEGFDTFGSSGAPVGLEEKYPVHNLASVDVQMGAGRFGQFAIRLGGGAGGSAYVQTPALGSFTTLCTGFNFNTVTSAASPIVTFMEGVTQGFNVRMGASGQLQAYRGDTLLAETAALISTGTWYHIQAKVTCSNSGAYEIRLNGVDVLSDTGVDTQASASPVLTAVRVRSGGSFSDHWIDDWYVSDDFEGAKMVYTVYPSGDDSVELSPSAGSDNFAMVDETFDEDDSYVSGVGTDLYTFTPPAIDTISAIQLNAVARDEGTEGGTITLIAGAAGASQAVNSSEYQTFSEVFEVNPSTTDPWEPEDITNEEFGLEVS